MRIAKTTTKHKRSKHILRNSCVCARLVHTRFTNSWRRSYVTVWPVNITSHTRQLTAGLINRIAIINSMLILWWTNSIVTSHYIFEGGDRYDGIKQRSEYTNIFEKAY